LKTHLIKGIENMLKEVQLDSSYYDKVLIAIERIKTMAPIAYNIYGLYTVMVSGGKDSSVITDLAIKSKIKCRFQTSWTGIEYPETVYFLRKEKERIEKLGYSFEFIIPRDKNGKQITMWKMIEKYGFPTRQMRFCCKRLKEVAGRNSYCILGIRWAESTRRKNSRFIHEISGRLMMTNNDNEATRRLNENCMKKRKYMLNPIIDWNDDEAWEYIHSNKIPYNPLYDSGYKRIGCIGCPMISNKKDLENNPRYAALYKRAAERFLLNYAKDRTGIKSDIDTYYNWWVNFCSNKSDKKIWGDYLWD
jgi:phosphoadenosine phosphosulfate reductase